MLRLLFSLGLAVRADDRPNIVFIMLDDLGWSCWDPLSSVYNFLICLLKQSNVC